MAKFYGEIGFGLTVDLGNGIWEDQIVEKVYSGDLVRNSLRVQDGQDVNDDLSVGHSISIVADPYASEHIFAIRYVKWNGAFWKLVHVEIQRPRLLLRLGGVYNGPKAAAPSTP